jgi:methylated-DNA-[protein]-cysteine S-methyltransferase
MTASTGFALFDTAIGRCAVSWGESGITGMHLPGARDAATRARVLERVPGARELPPPPDVERAVADVTALLRGESIDLSRIGLDMNGVPPFHRRVYEAARTIPPGTTRSYGAVAAQLDAMGSARAVGQALGRNPFALLVPCHRVLAAGGKVGGFSASGGVRTKLRLLAIEGAIQAGGAGGAAPLFEGDGAFAFDPAAAVDHIRASDTSLARIIDDVGPFAMRLKATSSVFGALAESIVYQQLSGRAAATIFARVQALFAWTREGPTPRQILRASEDKLRGAGLSRAKLLSLRDLARRAADGKLPELADLQRMDDEAIIERLTEVRGIGRWTVEMLLIFRLGRPDVLPVDDYGVRKGLAVALRKRELPTRKDLERRGVRWKPYRSVASWYLWRALDLKTP